jgi:hypothetical protein
LTISGPTNATRPIRYLYLDLVYAKSTLEAAGHADLSAAVATKLTELQGELGDYDQAEEREVIAEAKVAGRDASLDQIYRACAAHVREHHPSEFGRLFPKPPSRIAEASHAEELVAVRTLTKDLEGLAVGEPLRDQFFEKLTSAANELEKAIGEQNETLGRFEGERAAMDTLRASVDVLRQKTHAALLERVHDKKLADSFFRSA